MDSWIPWSIPSVLLQRLPVHREQQIPLLPLSRFPGRALKCPQHSLNCKSWGQKTKHTRQTRGGAVPRAFFPCRGLKSHKNLDGRLGSLLMDEPGRSHCPESSCGHCGDPHTLQILTSRPLGTLSVPAHGIFSFLGFKAVCVSGNFPPESTPKARSCLQGDSKHPSPALLTPSRALEELQFAPWTRTCSLFSLKEAFYIEEAIFGEENPQYLLFQGV